MAPVIIVLAVVPVPPVRLEGIARLLTLPLLLLVLVVQRAQGLPLVLLVVRPVRPELIIAQLVSRPAVLVAPVIIVLEELIVLPVRPADIARLLMPLIYLLAFAVLLVRGLLRALVVARRVLRVPIIQRLVKALVLHVRPVIIVRAALLAPPAPPVILLRLALILQLIATELVHKVWKLQEHRKAPVFGAFCLSIDSLLKIS